MTCFVLEDMLYPCRISSLNYGALHCFDIEQTTENKNLKCALFFKNSVQNHCKTKIREPLRYTLLNELD